MTVAPAHALFRLVTESHDLRTFALTHDRRADARIADGRTADDQFFAVVREQHAVEDHGGVDSAVDVVEAQDIAFADLELAAMGFDDGIHAKVILNKGSGAQAQIVTRASIRRQSVNVPQNLVAKYLHRGLNVLILDLGTRFAAPVARLSGGGY